MVHQQIWNDVKENQRRLDSCKRHRFEPHDPPYLFGEKFTCLNCGGRLGAVETYQYTLGYEAAGGDANDVFKGFR